MMKGDAGEATQSQYHHTFSLSHGESINHLCFCHTCTHTYMHAHTCTHTLSWACTHGASAHLLSGPANILLSVNHRRVPWQDGVCCN